MCKPPGTLRLKIFGPGKIWVENVSTQNTCILAFLHTFVLISGNPTKTQNIFIIFLTELDDLKKTDFSFWVKKGFGSKLHASYLFPPRLNASSSLLSPRRPRCLTDYCHLSKLEASPSHSYRSSRPRPQNCLTCPPKHVNAIFDIFATYNA